MFLISYSLDRQWLYRYVCAHIIAGFFLLQLGTVSVSVPSTLAVFKRMLRPLADFEDARTRFSLGEGQSTIASGTR